MILRLLLPPRTLLQLLGLRHRRSQRSIAWQNVGWQVFHHVLDSHDCMLIIASDGVWDSVRPGEAVKVAAEKAYDGARHAAQELVEHAFQFSKAQHPTRGHDNTTAIVFLY